MVALTFDDGPSEFTFSLLNTLKSKDVKATFFVLGVSIIDNGQDELKAAFDAGHQIALHTNTHPSLDTLSKVKQIEEMNTVRDIVKSIIGVEPSYMRPPYGACAETCQATMKELAYSIVNWNDDSEDWKLISSPVPQQLSGTSKNILLPINSSDKIKDSFIILQHDTHDYSINVVGKVIDRIQGKGYKFVTIAECNSYNPSGYKDGLEHDGEVGEGQIHHSLGHPIWNADKFNDSFNNDNNNNNDDDDARKI
ncbi:hypothetical protein G9A89_020248 [Geosiphon pyriformis]|nr:hypothetical protein G9A89_020248 [Geosiphon pyriformis]